MLFLQPLLQALVHHCDRDAQVADLEFCRLEGCVAVLGAQVPGDRDLHLLSGEFGSELAASDIVLEADLIIRHLWLLF